jgi:hypothetical protein
MHDFIPPKILYNLSNLDRYSRDVKSKKYRYGVIWRSSQTTWRPFAHGSRLCDWNGGFRESNYKN